VVGQVSAGPGSVLMRPHDRGVDSDLAVEFVDRLGEHPYLCDTSVVNVPLRDQRQNRL
jgi:hypothetical protein